MPQAGGAGPQFVISDLAYLDFDQKTKRMKVKTIQPGVTKEQIKDNTVFDIIIPDNVPETKPPTEHELKMLREKVDHLAIRKMEVLTGKEKNDPLQYIIEKEMKMQKRVIEIIK